MYVFDEDVYVRASVNDQTVKLFKAIHLEETDYSLFELVWNIELSADLSYGHGYLYAINADDDNLYKYNPRCKIAVRDQAEKVAENVARTNFKGNYLYIWLVPGPQGKLVVKRKDMTVPGSTRELYDDDEMRCSRNLRRSSDNFYCLSGVNVVAKNGVIPAKNIDRFEIFDADRLVGVDKDTLTTIWILSNNWNEFYNRPNQGKILDIAMLNGKILGLMERAGGPPEIIFLDRNVFNS